MITGYVVADAEDDFRRMRRRAALVGAVTRLRGRPADLIRYEEVIACVGRIGDRDRGEQIVDLDTIVGTVGRVHDFDRRFRPRRSVDPGRWQRLDRAGRSGEFVAPVELYRVAGQHYVSDGHHRISVARALGRTTIDAHVIEVLTRVAASEGCRPSCP